MNYKFSNEVLLMTNALFIPTDNLTYVLFNEY